MAKCQNCGATMSCGCQRRISADGKKGCSKCITDPKKPVPATVQKVRNSQYGSPIPILNSVELTNTDK